MGTKISLKDRIKDINITEEDIREYLQPHIDYDNKIEKRVENKTFDLSKFFNEVMSIDGVIDNESIAYYPTKYEHLYEDMQLELDVICRYIYKLYLDSKAYHPPFYKDTDFGLDIYFTYDNQNYCYFIMQGQGTLEGITKYGIPNDIQYILHLC